MPARAVRGVDFVLGCESSRGTSGQRSDARRSFRGNGALERSIGEDSLRGVWLAMVRVGLLLIVSIFIFWWFVFVFVWGVKSRRLAVYLLGLVSPVCLCTCMSGILGLLGLICRRVGVAERARCWMWRIKARESRAHRRVRVGHCSVDRERSSSSSSDAPRWARREPSQWRSGFAAFDGTSPRTARGVRSHVISS